MVGALPRILSIKRDRAMRDLSDPRYSSCAQHLEQMKDSRSVAFEGVGRFVGGFPGKGAGRAARRLACRNPCELDSAAISAGGFSAGLTTVART